MTFIVGNRGIVVVVGLAFALGVLQWQTLLFFVIQDIRPLHSRRMTSIATTPANARTCSQDPHSSRNDICALLPTDVTASFVWNNQQLFASDRNRIFVAGNNTNNNNNNNNNNNSPEDDASSQLLQFLNAYRLLRGVRNLPLHHSWKRVVENRNKDRPLQIWLFVNPLDHVPRPTDCVEEEEESSSSSSSCAPTWIQLLQEMAAQHCSILFDIEYTVFDWSFATTEFYTQLLIAQREQTHGPDVILHALSRHDLRHAGMEHKDPHSVLWEEERRRILQDFVRAGRRANPCQDTVVLFVDDNIPSTSTTQPTSSSSPSLWVEQVNSRMLLQVSEHYGAGLISYHQVVMEWMIMRNNGPTNHPLSLLAPNDDAGQFQATAHKVLAQCVLYGLLHFTVTYCNTRDQSTTTTTSNATVAVVESMVPLDIAHRVRTVLPPFLDAEQTFLTVSEEWRLQEEMEQQFHAQYCTKEGTVSPTICLANFYVGQPLSTLGNGEIPDGWTLSSEGILHFGKSAHLKWSLGDINEESKARLQGGRITLFVRLPNAENVQLHWTVTSQESSTTGKFSSSIIENDASGKRNVAMQMVAQLPDRIGDDLSFHLECSHADDTAVVEIVGFFLCQKESIQRISS